MDGPGVLIDELEELNLDRPTTKPLKTSEELESLTVDEKLTDIERAVYLLSSGQEVQRISVITTLPSLLRDNKEECMKRVVPKVREVLHVAQQDMQLAAAKSFLKILQDKLVPLEVFTNTFLKTIVSCVDSKDPEVAAAWLSTLLDVIDLLPPEIIKSDILGIAIHKGRLQQPVSVRLSCCQILGKIVTKFESFVIKKEILPVVQQLCQDVEHEVRACMCSHLDTVARGLGLENTKSAILPELVELTNDEESNVRIAGLDTIVNILPMLDDELKAVTVVPLVCKFCQKAMQAEDSTLPNVASYIGKLCHGLQSNLTDEQKQWFIDFYKKLCKVGTVDKHKISDKNPPMALDMDSTGYEDDDWDTSTRQNAAYNFPAMAIFVGAKNMKSELLPTLSNLCKDPNWKVRKSTASGFHEIAKIMGQQVMVLFPDLLTLLKDDNIEVLKGVVATFPACLEVFSKTSTTLSDSKAAAVQEVVNTFLGAEHVVFSSNNWRVQEDMMRNLACLGKICSQDVLYNRIIPIIMVKMKFGRALPVRYAAARSLLVLMRHLHRQEQREQLTNTLIQDFGHGQSFHSRSLFIIVCKYFIELYSKAFFKEHLFEFVLPLIMDPVPNIRMRACSLLPSLKRLIKLPYDNALKGSLEQYVRKMLISDEQDRDVVMARTKAVDEMDQIPIQMESMVSRRKNFEDDIEDQVKEEEEKALLEIEEKERKEEELRATKGDRRNPVLKKDSIKGSSSTQKKLSSGTKGTYGNNSKSDISSSRRDSKGSTGSCSQTGPQIEPSSSRGVKQKTSSSGNVLSTSSSRVRKNTKQ
ncbi:serine/threonine-protein phosphatase 4 regulatory subunit 4-like isoform X2 [Babylonia areolata]|uniref:serine/threonine-protein phosphatase 4 regulatory subunit 4-like isoform X2 n=1 Tax=Babylonia areolata TaxID=304850 RepID=UPI003FD6A0F8